MTSDFAEACRKAKIDPKKMEAFINKSQFATEWEIVRRLHVLESYIAALRHARKAVGTRCGCGAVEMGSEENVKTAEADVMRTKAWVIEAIEEWTNEGGKR